MAEKSAAENSSVERSRGGGTGFIGRRLTCRGRKYGRKNVLSKILKSVSCAFITC